MLATLILGIAAGAGASWAEPHLREPLQSVAGTGAPLPATELRLYSFAVCLFAAAVVAAIFGDGSAIALALGALIGVAGPRIMDRIRGARVPDYGPDPD